MTSNESWTLGLFLSMGIALGVACLGMATFSGCKPRTTDGAYDSLPDAKYAVGADVRTTFPGQVVMGRVYSRTWLRGRWVYDILYIDKMGHRQREFFAESDLELIKPKAEAEDNE